MGKKKSGESIISRGIATGLRIIGIQSEKDKVFERCATVIEGRCMCASPYPYRRLSVEKHNKPVKMTFYKHEYRDEGSYTMEVDRKICALDLCQILAEKMQFGSMTFWSLVEFWVDKRAERVLEEHEIVVEVYKEMLKFKRRARVRYVMRQVITKFDFLIEPTKMRHEGGIICEDPELYENFHLICFIEKLIDENKCPAFFSGTIMLYKKGWKMAFILLKDETLYYTDDHNGKMKLIQLTEMCARIDLHDIPGLVEIGPVANLQIYRVIKSGTPLVESKESNAFLLRPVATPTVRAREETDAPKSSARIPVLPKGVIRCTSLSQNFATTWIALMRLAKYGKQLRENYRAFKNKNEAPTREFSRANVPNPELNSPLFRRRGCKSHLKERARKVGSREHLLLLDFSGGVDSSDSLSNNHLDRINFSMWGMGIYMIPPRTVPVKDDSKLRKLSYSLRRKLERKNIKPSYQYTETEAVKPLPSTSRVIGEDPAERTEKAKRFGAIRKIFSPKSRKGGKKEIQEEIEITAMPYTDNESEEKFVPEELVVQEGILIEIDSEPAAALQPDDEGATALNYYAVSSQETTTTAVQIHNENEQD